MTTTIRVANSTRDSLHDLARQAGLPMQEVVAQAIELYRRKLLLAEANAGYAALRESPAAWREVQEERAAWDATLADGLKGV